MAGDPVFLDTSGLLAGRRTVACLWSPLLPRPHYFSTMLDRHFPSTPMKHLAICILLLAASLALTLATGCSSTAIALKESFGYVKREQLVDNVKAARDEQQAAKKQFESALAEFLAVTGTSGGELETKYNKLKAGYEASEKRAAAVTDKIQSVDTVAQALFAEWKTEIGQYSSPQLKTASEQQLADTRSQYDKLLGSMRTAEGKMKPVLTAFKDQVMFLKHNLNARAIASLQTTATQVQTDVASLVRDMEASIAEANAFIDQMGTSK